jgi:DNA polymerase III subunit delta'
MFSEELKRRQPVVTKLLASALGNKRLASAYLLTGRAPEDKIQLAKELVSILNCQNLNRSGFACSSSGELLADACTNCRWISEDAHPQALRILASENGKKSKIPVEKARELTEELAKTSLYHRLVMVEDACEDVFHRPAANALLKSIEEPRSGITFLFFALTSGDVLRTIVSRCQTIECRASQDLSLRSLNKSNEEKVGRDALLAERLSPFIDQSGKGKGGFQMAALNLSAAIQDLVNEEVPFEEVIDYFSEQELHSLTDKLANEREAARYGLDLLALCEESKLKLSHYVSQKAVAETFAFSWSKLRERFLVSPSFARSKS